MKATISCILLTLFAAMLLFSTDTVVSLPKRGQDLHQPMTFVPNVATDIVTADVFVDTMYFANSSASSVTIVVTDKSTLCNGAACPWWPTITVDPNSVQTIPVGGVVSKGGVNWTASAANAVVGWVKGSYTR